MPNSNEWVALAAAIAIAAIAVSSASTVAGPLQPAGWGGVIGMGVLTAVGLVATGLITFKAAEKSVSAIRDQMKTSSIPETRRSIISINRAIDRLSVTAYIFKSFDIIQVDEKSYQLAFNMEAFPNDFVNERISLPDEIFVYAIGNVMFQNAIDRYRRNTNAISVYIAAPRFRENFRDRIEAKLGELDEDAATIMKNLRTRKRDLEFLLEDAEKVLHHPPHS